MPTRSDQLSFEMASSPLTATETLPIQSTSEEKIALALRDALEDLSRVSSKIYLPPPSPQSSSCEDDVAAEVFEESFLFQTCKILIELIVALLAVTVEENGTNGNNTKTAKHGDEELQINDWNDIEQHCMRLKLYPPLSRMQNRKKSHIQFLEHAYHLALHLQTLQLLSYRQNQRRRQQIKEDSKTEKDYSSTPSSSSHPSSDSTHPPSFSFLMDLMELPLPFPSTKATGTTDATKLEHHNQQQQDLSSLLSKHHPNLTSHQMSTINAVAKNFEKDYAMRLQMMKQKFDLLIHDDIDTNSFSADTVVGNKHEREDKNMKEEERQGQEAVLKQFILPSTYFSSTSAMAKKQPPSITRSKSSSSKNYRHKMKRIDRGGRVDNGDDRIKMPAYIPTAATITSKETPSRLKEDGNISSALQQLHINDDDDNGGATTSQKHYQRHKQSKYGGTEKEENAMGDDDERYGQPGGQGRSGGGRGRSHRGRGRGARRRRGRGDSSADHGNSH